MKKYCVGYELLIGYETEWFEAKNKKDAIKRAKEVIGEDMEVTHIFVKEGDE